MSKSQDLRQHAENCQEMAKATESQPAKSVSSDWPKDGKVSQRPRLG